MFKRIRIEKLTVFKREKRRLDFRIRWGIYIKRPKIDYNRQKKRTKINWRIYFLKWKKLRL